MKHQLQAACVYDLAAGQAAANPQAIVIEAPGRAPLVYGRLVEHIQAVVDFLRGSGIGRGDRVAVVLPNGPDMAVAFLAVSCAAASAPLNPGYRASEFEFYLSDLGAKAVIIPGGSAAAAGDVARRLGIGVIELIPSAEAGLFRLTTESSVASASKDGPAQSDDVALVLHTSGTTSRPKLVPLSHANVCVSAENIRATLALTPQDRCLNVMPLFHIHGLVGALLSSMAAGGSVVCTPGFRTGSFFPWLEAFRPSWYTAVPTIHQQVLEDVSKHPLDTKSCPLKFIRSSSSPLPPPVMEGLERSLGVPVIESYGMTEAAHQISSNPLPPLARKPASVGLAAGPEVAVMDEAGQLLPPGQAGEVVIRGFNVTRGYEANPAANERAFSEGWFRTGDQGALDHDGYLFLQGRLKEMINRGGEKIAPREIDEAILAHPAVAQAVAFAVPHETLGEDIAVALVLKASATATPREIRQFALAKLADHKVPSQVVILSEIPLGPTGKLQRIGLAVKLAEHLETRFVAPSTSVQKVLAEIWKEVLRVEHLGVLDNFFARGGDSLRAAQAASRIEGLFRIEFTLREVFQEPVLADQADAIEERLLAEIECFTEEETQALQARSLSHGGGVEAGS